MFLYIIIFFDTICFAQDWQPFPKNQQSYYKFYYYGAYGDSSIDLIVQDSIVINGIQSNYYFRTKTLIPGIENCREETFPLYIGSGNYGLNSVDSIANIGDTFFISLSLPLVYFLPYSNPGDSWVLNSTNPVIIHCDSLKAVILFGQPDSIKFFHTNVVTPNPIISLSKHHGFINFIPFSHLTNNYPRKLELIGFTDSTGNYGFQPPQFVDYMPYQVGDILKWRFENIVYWGPGGYTEYYQDSITQLFVYPDSFGYTFDRIKIDRYNNVTTIHNMGSRIYSDLNFRTLLNTPIHDIGVSWSGVEGNELYGTSFLNIYSDSVQPVKYYQKEFSWNSFLIDTSCIVTGVVDGIYDYYGFNTHQGLIYERYIGQGGEWGTYLIGAKFGNYVYGNPYLNVSVAELTNPIFTIYPNPASEMIHISGINNGGKGKIILSDIRGMKLLIRDIPFLYDDYIFILPALIAEGFYFLEIVSEKHSFTRKIIVKRN